MIEFINIISYILSVSNVYIIILVVVFILVLMICYYIINRDSKQMIDLADKYILITGGARGLGRQLALHLATEHAKLLLLDIDEKALNETVKDIQSKGGTVRGYKCDVAKREEVYKIAEEIFKCTASIDVLINNAGTVKGKYFLDTPDCEIVRTLEVNAFSHFWTIKAFLPNMLTNECGSIVTVSSLTGSIPSIKLTDYSASKAALTAFHNSLRLELRKICSNICMLLVTPYLINTGMFAGVVPNYQYILPYLKEDNVAKDIITAIKMRREYLTIPKPLALAPILMLLPTYLQDFILDIGGCTTIMDKYQGRT